MHDFMDLLRDTSILAAALKSIQLNDKERESLRRLHASAVGFDSGRDSRNIVRAETSYHCSKIGGYLTRHFDGVGPRDKMMWIGYLVQDAKGGERWVMRSQVRAAISSLHWF